jgi:hypothetical protein
MAPDLAEEAIDRLYAVPLEEFVAERTRLARELRAGGDRAAAEQVAKLAKPSAAAWALNHVAREQPDTVEEWIGATVVLRDASTRAAEVGGGALRAAMAAHRAATAGLIDVVRDRAQPSGRALSEAMLDRVRTLLQSATADAQLAERLRSGRLTQERAPTDLAPAPEKQDEHAAAKPLRRAPEPEPDDAARAARRDLERRAAAARETVERLRSETARCEAEAESADERVAQTREALRRVEAEAGAAHAALEEARDAIAAAEQEHRQLQDQLRRQ